MEKDVEEAQEKVEKLEQEKSELTINAESYQVIIQTLEARVKELERQSDEARDDADQQKSAMAQMR